RKQARILEHVSEPALFDRQSNTAGRIEEHRRSDGDAAAVGLIQAGDQIDQSRLSGTACAKYRGESGQRKIEVASECKCAQLLRGIDAQPFAHVRPSMRRTRRASISETKSAPSASTSEITTRRRAAASPSGVCVRL